MNRKLKILGLTLFAVFATSAVAASGASAEGELFHSTLEPTTLTGSAAETQDFETVQGIFECKSISFTTMGMKKTASEFKAVPTYGECEAKATKRPARVTMTSCYYVFTSSIPAGKKDAPVHVECATTGDAIDLEFEEEGGKWRQCIDIPAQTPSNGTTYKSNGNHLDITATMTGMAYSLTGVCGGGGGVGAGYSGKITVKGTEGKNETVLTWK